MWSNAYLTMYALISLAEDGPYLLAYRCVYSVHMQFRCRISSGTLFIYLSPNVCLLAIIEAFNLGLLSLYPCLLFHGSTVHCVLYSLYVQLLSFYIFYGSSMINKLLNVIVRLGLSCIFYACLSTEFIHATMISFCFVIYICK